MSVALRAARVDDAEAMYRTMRAAFAEYDGALVPGSGALRETLDDVRAALAAGGGVIAEIDGAIAGCARFRIAGDAIHADRVAVLPAYRGRGVAVALMAAIEREGAARGAREGRVNVRVTLPSNLRFYENLGYRAVASRRYPEGTDFTVTLAKTLAG